MLKLYQIETAERGRKLSEKTKMKKLPKLKKSRSTLNDKESYALLLLCIPAILGYLFFHYIPLAASLIIPFKDYKFSLGILGSEWCGLKNFSWIVSSSGVINAMKNTVLYGAWFLLVGPTVNVIVALMLYEINNRNVLKGYQTIITLPSFMSYVVVGYITYAILSPTYGVLPNILAKFGIEGYDAYMTTGVWPAILTIVYLWKGVGTGSLMYYASLVGSDQSIYEAAEIDGASRLQRIRYISIPHLKPMYCIFLIMGVAGLVGGNFDLYYIIPRDVKMLYSVTDILPTYVYRALSEGNYAMGATVGIVQGVVGMLLVIGTNAIVKKISPDDAMF